MSSIDENLVGEADRILEDKPLCDWCLGRKFARILRGLTNEERGRTIRLFLAMRYWLRRDESSLRRVLSGSPLHERLLGEKSEPCWICENKLNYDLISKRILERLSEYEFETFLVGITRSKIVERDELVQTPFAESVKNEAKREIGKRLSELSGKSVNFDDPDIVAIVDLDLGDIARVQVKPVFVRGWYRKLVGGISQAPWLCMKCRGRGCIGCNFSGRRFSYSIAELIGDVGKRILEGSSYRFHASGREDVDVPTLGSGRPFILEIIEPRKRNFDPKILERAINEANGDLIHVRIDGFARREDVEILKRGEKKKGYLALVEVEDRIQESELDKLSKLSGSIIRQRTPKRVLRRRKDSLRMRRILSIGYTKLRENIFILSVLAEGGLYIKELISGDEGRTRPSIAEVLGKRARCRKLMVMWVEG